MIFSRYGRYGAEMTMMAPRQVVIPRPDPVQEQIPVLTMTPMVFPIQTLKMATKVATETFETPPHVVDPNAMLDKGLPGIDVVDGRGFVNTGSGAIYVPEPTFFQKMKPYLPLIGIGVAGLTVVTIILLRK